MNDVLGISSGSRGDVAGRARRRLEHRLRAVPASAADQARRRLPVVHVVTLDPSTRRLHVSERVRPHARGQRCPRVRPGATLARSAGAGLLHGRAQAAATCAARSRPRPPSTRSAIRPSTASTRGSKSAGSWAKRPGCRSCSKGLNVTLSKETFGANEIGPVSAPEHRPGGWVLNKFLVLACLACALACRRACPKIRDRRPRACCSRPRPAPPRKPGALARPRPPTAGPSRSSACWCRSGGVSLDGDRLQRVLGGSTTAAC